MIRLAGLANILRALSHRDYALFATGNVVALTGYWMQRVGVGWLTWQLTESGAWLGAMAFADLFPVVIFAPVAGAISDRWNVIRIIRVAQLLSLGQALILCALTLAGVITIHLLWALTFLNGFFTALNQPSRLALVPALVPREDLPAAVAIGAISFNTAQFIGPAMAGIIIVAHGAAGAFLANAVTWTFFLITLMGVRLRTPPEAARHGGIFSQLVEGVRYAAGRPGIPAVLVMIAVVALCGRPFVDLFAGFAEAIFASGARGLAVLTSATGLGAIVCGLWLAQRGDPAGLTRIIVRSFLVLAAALAAFVASPTLLPAAAAAFVAGFCFSAIGISTQVMLQTSIDAHVRGRIMSLYVVLFRAMPALGALTMGVASETFGLRAPVATGAVILFAFYFGVRRRRRGIAEVLERPAAVAPQA